MNKDSNLTRIHDYIKATLPWAHGRQLNSLTTFVSAIFDKQTGCQAELARTQGDQEAACKRLSRLIHRTRDGISDSKIGKKSSNINWRFMRTILRQMTLKEKNRKD